MAGKLSEHPVTLKTTPEADALCGPGRLSVRRILSPEEKSTLLCISRSPTANAQAQTLANAPGVAKSEERKAASEAIQGRRFDSWQ